MEISDSVRAKGAWKALIGIAGGVLAAFGLYWLQREGFAPNGAALIGLAAPGAYGVVGLLELSTGVPFSRMSEWWDGLRGWQRGVFGLAVVVLAFGAMILSIALVFGEDI